MHVVTPSSLCSLLTLVNADHQTPVVPRSRKRCVRNCTEKMISSLPVDCNVLRAVSQRMHVDQRAWCGAAALQITRTRTR